MSTTDCSVCCEASKKILTCPGCGVTYCKKCQVTNNESTGSFRCLGCRLEFTQQFVVSIGMYAAWKTLKQDLLLAEQKSLLPQTQPFVEWEREFRRQKSRLRFGERMTIPPRPNLETIVQRQAAFFSCPVEGCRGFIENGADACGLCKERVCRACREAVRESQSDSRTKEGAVRESQSDSRTKEGAVRADAARRHVCNPSILKSIEMLTNETRPCPKCTAPIYKTQGCNHMHCTHCNTHFDWHTGEVLKISTNGHYRDLLIRAAGPVAVRDVSASAGAGGAGEGICGGGPSPLLFSTDDAAVHRTLLSDVEVIRFTIHKFYNQNLVTARYENDVLNLRIRFLLGEIDEVAWKRKLYTAYRTFQMNSHFAVVFNLYLMALRGVETAEELVGLIVTTNESLQSLADEFQQSTPMRIRLPTDSVDVPALLR
jgi:hypothetical protein